MEGEPRILQFTFISPSKHYADYRLTDLTLTVQEGSLASELSQNDQQTNSEVLHNKDVDNKQSRPVFNPFQFTVNTQKLDGRKHIKAALQSPIQETYQFRHIHST